ncbi:biotin--[acetyl-CoA-carboxylase] ligase [Propionibacterium acidifaciens]|mgnify:CR=1 FL=1|uniref:biotin--[acetyl-CoA-carboxylase] ligase n=1 Tax=Propionibacterium acidifaciens TaxID=556499 RepID=UPI0023F0FB78|nr:hypothetical protein [Propionibacterium acidifaciens]
MGEMREKDDGEGMSGTREELTGVPGLARLVVVDRTGSTNDDLRSALTGVDGRLDLRAAAAWPHISALWARRQDAGRGRAGRRWITPPGSALTVSFVLRPLVPAAALAWLPLLAGLAARDVVDAILISARAPWRARTKWPNDVVLVPNERAGEGTAAGASTGAGTGGGAGDAAVPVPAEIPGWGRARKVAGVLAELIPTAGGIGARTSAGTTGTADASGAVAAGAADAPGAVGAAGAPGGGGAVGADRGAACAVVLGIGVNTGQSESELPVPWATSLRLAGARVEPRALLEPLSARLDELVTAWEAGEGDPDAGDGALGAALRRACTTLGRRVRVDAPGGVLRGTAVDIAPGLVLRGADGTMRTVDAGDVSHVRTDGAVD